MEELAKRKKGGAVVIMDTDSYIKEANRQLTEKASYKQLTHDPTLHTQNGQPNNRKAEKRKHPS